MKTTIAANRLCQPTISAIEAANNSTQPISTAELLDQRSKMHQVLGIDGRCGATPLVPNISYNSGNSHNVHNTASAPKAIRTKPSVYIGWGPNQNPCQLLPIAGSPRRIPPLYSFISVPNLPCRGSPPRSLYARFAQAPAMSLCAQRS